MPSAQCSMRLKKVCPHVFSAVLYISSIRKLHCDFGHDELSYTRKVAIVYHNVITIAVIVKLLA